MFQTYLRNIAASIRAFAIESRLPNPDELAARIALDCTPDQFDTRLAEVSELPDDYIRAACSRVEQHVSALARNNFCRLICRALALDPADAPDDSAPAAIRAFARVNAPVHNTPNDRREHIDPISSAYVDPVTGKQFTIQLVCRWMDYLETYAALKVGEWVLTAHCEGRLAFTACVDAYASKRRNSAGVSQYDAMDAADMVSDIDVSNIRSYYQAGGYIAGKHGLMFVRTIWLAPSLRGTKLSTRLMAFACRTAEEKFKRSFPILAYSPQQLADDLAFPKGYTLPQATPGSDNSKRALARFFESYQPAAASAADSAGIRLRPLIQHLDLGANQTMLVMGRLHLGASSPNHEVPPEPVIIDRLLKG